MKILVINCGSSSLRFQLINMENEEVLSKGICDRIGLEGSFMKCKHINQDEITINQEISNHTSAVQLVLKCIADPRNMIIKSLDEISAVGHRVVHGGEFFHDSVLIDHKVLDAIEQCSRLAPLHNPSNIIGIKACRELLPSAPMVAVFDTAFHQTMPDYAYIYPIPYEMYGKHKIRKYGFHGISHRYIAAKTSEIMQAPLEQLKIISCHLGGGASICAINKGKSVDTSMGFTPLEGLMMGTRSGTIDPAIIPYLMENEQLGIKEINNILNKKSGILGVSGVSSDFRDIQKAAYQDNERAKLTIDMFCYRIKKFIGEYMAVLDGADAIIFTAGIGEHDWRVRQKSLENLDCMGIIVDEEQNKNAVDRTLEHKEIEITHRDSRTRVFVIHTNEELMIARDTYKVVGENPV